MAKTKLTRTYPKTGDKFYPGDIVIEDIRSIVKAVGKEFTKLEGKSILVTGASGLYGSYFLDTVAYLNQYSFSKPCKILALQRNDPISSPRLWHLAKYPHIKFINHDVSKPFETRQHFDYIIHSAGMSAPAFFTADPLGTIHVNINGVEWLLEKAKKDKVLGMLYMSSGEIYGKPQLKSHYISENYNGNVNPLDTRGCYAESKRLAETYCSIYYTVFKVNVKIARPFATYGPGITVNDRRVIADFMKTALSGKPIQMMNRGSDIKTFCYISDAITAFWKILLQGKAGEAYNVGSPEDRVSVYNLARLMHKVCNIKEAVKRGTDEKTHFIQDAPTLAVPDISKISRQLGFKPVIRLEEGIKGLVLWNMTIPK